MVNSVTIQNHNGAEQKELQSMREDMAIAASLCSHEIWVLGSLLAFMTVGILQISHLPIVAHLYSSDEAGPR